MPRTVILKKIVIVKKEDDRMTTFHQWNFFSHTNRPDEFLLSLNSLKGGSKVRLLFLPFIFNYYICYMLLLSSLLSLRIRVREFKNP